MFEEIPALSGFSLEVIAASGTQILPLQSAGEETADPAPHTPAAGSRHSDTCSRDRGWLRLGGRARPRLPSPPRTPAPTAGLHQLDANYTSEFLLLKHYVK